MLQSRTLFIGGAMLVALSCTPKKSSDERNTLKEYRDATPQGEVVPVGSLRPRQFEGLSFEIRRKEATPEQLASVASPAERSDQFSYDVLFSKLTQDQFLSLKNSFWKDNPRNEPAPSMSLVDFLPPAFQALNGHRFEVQEAWLDGVLAKAGGGLSRKADVFLVRPQMRSLTNCWTTAYELLRFRNEAFLHFFASDRALAPYLDSTSSDGKKLQDRDTEYSTFVKELTWKEACVRSDKEFTCPEGNAAERNTGLQFGDLVLIYSSDTALEHAALFLADDLYFEKSGAKSSYLYRVNTWQEIRRNYRGNNIRVRVRRFVGKNSLPDPRSVFGKFDREERDVAALIPAQHAQFLFAAHQPSQENSARDLSIYSFVDLSIEQTEKGWKLEDAAKNPKTFLLPKEE